MKNIITIDPDGFGLTIDLNAIVAIRPIDRASDSRWHVHTTAGMIVVPEQVAESLLASWKDTVATFSPEIEAPANLTDYFVAGPDQK